MDDILLVIIYIISMQVLAVNALENTCLSLEHEVKVGDMDDHCSAYPACNKSYKITNLDLQPYIQLFSVEDSFLKKCCGKCTPSVNVTIVPPESEIHDIIYTSHPDIVFPVLHKSKETMLHSYYYIPTVRVPNFVYITQMPESSFFRAITACINLYPLLLVCLLMSLVAGFVVWCMETGNNRSFFPRSFLIGWINGIWWSTITLVSTGLEKTPKSLPGRIFAIIWIVIGVTMLGLLTSSITAMMVKITPIPTMKGAKVGALKYRYYEEYIIRKHGGTLQQYNETLELQEQFHKLIHLFQLKEIDGILFDKYLLAYQYNNQMHHKEDDSNIKIDLEYFMNNTVHTDVNDGEDMSYGILVKDGDVHSYLRDEIKENWQQYELLFVRYTEANTEQYREKYVQSVRATRLATIFSPGDPYVYYAMAGFSGALVLICIVGFLYERKRYVVRTYSVESAEVELPQQIT